MSRNDGKIIGQEKERTEQQVSNGASEHESEEKLLHN